MNKIVYFFSLSILFLFYACGGNGNENYIDESGTIETTNAVVSSQVVGQVEKIIFEEGAFVKAGDTVLIINHEGYLLQLRQAEASRDLAKAQLDLLTNGARKEDIKIAEEQFNQAKSNFDLAQKDKERFKSLYDSQSITKKQFDDVVTRFDIAQSQLNGAKENLTKIKNIARPEEIRQAKSNYEKTDASVALIQKSITDCFVVAPFNGTIVKSFVEKGEMLSMLSNLFKISDLSKVELVIYVSEEDLGKVKLGQTADVSTDTYKDKTYEGKVKYISPEAEFTPKNIQTKDERTKLVFAVKIEIPNPDSELKAGMPADAVVKL
ncbi:MAG: hypothetical protein A2068_08335 [Ignavibacteria bacterium GWB2_35_6b]|nr:MAG: hypothetical protein A2068_08335 [Ignavibacteria bacterium GWB2_35_6b]